jgi:hypothetical protein
LEHGVGSAKTKNNEQFRSKSWEEDLRQQLNSEPKLLMHNRTTLSTNSENKIRMRILETVLKLRGPIQKLWRRIQETASDKRIPKTTSGNKDWQHVWNAMSESTCWTQLMNAGSESNLEIHNCIVRVTLV